MSLARRLFFTISLLVMLLLVVNLLLSVMNAKRYLSDQLQVLAEDTATSLGLTISQAAAEKDTAQVQTMINVIFDRGYYLSIIYSDLNGKVVVSRSREIKVQGVPDWFVKVVPIPLRTGKTDIVSGWYQLGGLSVVVHPGYAYRDMWRVFVDQLWLCIFIAVLFYGLTGLALKTLLKPLRLVEHQANAICKKEFVIYDDLPKAKELRRVVQAMNRMVAKVRDMFAFQVDITNQLRRDVAVDALTGLANKEEFDAQVSTWIKSETGGGPVTCIFLRVQNLKEINDQHGAQEADAWLCKVANHLKQSLKKYDQSIIARRSGGDFSVLIPAIEFKQAQEISKQLVTIIGEAAYIELAKLNAGAVIFPAPLALSDMLSATDAVLRRSIQRGASVYEIDEHEGQSLIRPAGQWRSVLEDVLVQKNLQLFSQNIIHRDGADQLYDEVLARVNDAGKIVNAGIFWPLVERFAMEVFFDKLVVSKAQDLLSQNTLDTGALGVNLSPASIQSEMFLNWLADDVLSKPSARNLVFEIPERVLYNQNDLFNRFITMLSVSQAKLALDRFGIAPYSLGCLQSLPLDFVKIDSRFVIDIDQHVQNQFYVRNLISIARSCDVITIAEGVESPQQWHKLLELGVDAGQGYYFDKPKLIE